MSIKLCRQQVVSHHAFDQRSRWIAIAPQLLSQQIVFPGGSGSDTWRTKSRKVGNMAGLNIFVLCLMSANVLNSMLRRNSGKGTVGSRKDSSGSTAPVIPEEMLSCHCNQCPEDSINNTCRTDGYCFSMVEQEEGKSPVITFGCLSSVGSEFQCMDTGNARLRRIMECCKDQDYCNRDLRPTLPRENRSSLLPLLPSLH
ncbi:bone morphogenetic protein receptor type-1B-like [Triplophysa rosa]|uniref:bone morphogenetic protein receptor type-1B-like n=1 Tax=Triplophysa rosa TaxID=992332 RepID=UPI002545ED70|nr:bone morphogenetic protein receptor type-1B-like [Triplophysa rosa]